MIQNKNKTMLLITNIIIFTTLFCFNSYGYQIASNHSYIKNSTFTTDHTININGYGNFRFNYGDVDMGNNKKNTSLNVQNEISVNINLEKEIDEITKVGINYIPTLNNNYIEFDRYFAYISGYYGRIEMGNTSNIFNDMKVGADTIALGSGGIGGNFIRDIRLQAGHIFILSPNSFMNQNFGLYNDGMDDDYWDDSKYLAKINYFSPEFFGFQVGVGITPNVKIKEEYISSLHGDVNLGTFLNYGVSYINTFDTVGIAISAVGESNISNSMNKTNDEEEKIENKFKSTEIGLNINYFGLTLAGSMGTLNGNLDNTILDSDFEKYIKKGSYTTYGFAYEMGNMSLSLTRFESKYKDYTEFSSMSFAIEKNLSKGVSIYGEYIDYKSKIITSTEDEYKGFNVFAGVILSFE